MTSGRTLTVMASVAVVFGLATLIQGGAVLFFDGEARRGAGHIVFFVLGFNFFAGFFYVVTGVGFWMRKAWSVVAAGVIAAATMVVFLALGFHIWSGGIFEIRTVIAMGFRSLVWIVMTLTGSHVMRTLP